MSSAKTAVVTGSNRGIGLSFCTQLSSEGFDVVALCRKPSPELKALNIEIISGIELGNPDIMQSLSESIGDRPVHLLINNAGILHNEILGSINYQSLLNQLQVNALAPLMLVELLLPNLLSAANQSLAKIAMITSRMGSIADNSSGGRYGYRMSKAALNSASVSLAKDLYPQGIAVGIYHPGLVGTDMIQGAGDITPDEAASRLLKRISTLTLEKSGQFLHSNGSALPW